MTPTATTLSAVPPVADWRDFFALTKPRVLTLVVFTGLCGLLAAPVSVHPVIGFTAILCIAMAAGAAGALNQWYESDIDALMKRTRARPLPAGRMSRESALHFGVGLGGFSVVLMGLATNWVTAAILLVSIIGGVIAALLLIERKWRRDPAAPQVPYGVAISCSALLTCHEPLLNHFR